jgi:hypothetical protein
MKAPGANCVLETCIKERCVAHPARAHSSAMKPYCIFLAGAMLAACSPTADSPTSSGWAGNQEQTTTIPVRFQGTWTANPEGRNLPGRENPTVIGATTWQGHESSGEVKSVRINAPNDITITVAMTGEGDQWVDQTRLRLTAGGRELIVVGAGSQSGATLYRVR